jgi:hypothetical protein
VSLQDWQNPVVLLQIGVGFEQPVLLQETHPPDVELQYGFGLMQMGTLTQEKQ